MTSMFKGVREAKANFGANYEREGKYVMFLRRVKMDKNRKNEWFIAMEKVCIQCLDPKDEPKPHKPGESLSHLFRNYGNGKDFFLPEFKAMIMNVMDVSETEIDEDACDVICSEEQPLAYLFLEMDNMTITTREKQIPITKVRYIRSIPYSEILESEECLKAINKFLSKDEIAFIEKAVDEELKEQE